MRSNDQNSLGAPNVGIVSLFGLYNFGNRLQGYAVDAIYRTQGAQPTTVVMYPKLGVSHAKQKVRDVLLSLKPSSLQAMRAKRFSQFVENQDIHYVLLPTQISKLSSKFDYFVAGSDQVWHPRADLYSDTKFLRFARTSQRVALAPSLGVTALDEELHTQYREALTEFKNLSVRENEGADVVEALTGERPIVLPDPTFGLTREEWETVAERGHVRHEKYILLYFLGTITKENREKISALGSKLDAVVLNLADTSSELWASGPQDFLSLIRSATLVLTDSYHASIFSTIFEVPFYVFKREEASSTYSRIATLIETMRLDGRESHQIDFDRPLCQDFSLPRELLKVQHQALHDFVRESLDRD